MTLQARREVATRAKRLLLILAVAWPKGRQEALAASISGISPASRVRNRHRLLVDAHCLPYLEEERTAR
eukprot:4484241-Amphidinium_carterae.1